MPRLTTFNLCELAQNMPDNEGSIKLHIVSPLDFLAPKYIPGVFTFSISFGIIGVDKNEECNVEVKIFDPDKNEIFTTGGMLIPAMPQQKFNPDEYVGFHIGLDIKNLEIKAPGSYEAQIRVNDEVIGNERIAVIQGGE